MCTILKQTATSCRYYDWFETGCWPFIYIYAFIQSYSQCIQALHFMSICVFPANQTFCAANVMLYQLSYGNTVTRCMHWEKQLWPTTNKIVRLIKQKRRVTHCIAATIKWLPCLLSTLSFFMPLLHFQFCVNHCNSASKFFSMKSPVLYFYEQITHG